MTKTYSEKLRDPRWQKKRLEVLSRDEFTCTLCKDTETELHIHHKEYFGEPWEADSDKLITVCKDCHLLLEAWLLPEDIYSVLKLISESSNSISFVCKATDGSAAFTLYNYDTKEWQGILYGPKKLKESIEFITSQNN